jgi:hypothetical protein
VNNLPVDHRTTTALFAQEDDESIDEMVASLAEPVVERPSLLDRILAFLSELTATPLRSSLLTAWAFAVIVVAVTWLVQPSVNVRTSLGPAKARCGIDVYLYGYPDRAVAGACRHAEAVNFAFFVPAMVVVLTGIVAAGLLAFRRSIRLRQPGADPQQPGADPQHFLLRLRSSPPQAALVLVGSLAAILGMFALRPVPVSLDESGSLVSAHCGVDAYFRGYPDPVIGPACKHAFAARSHWIEICGALAVIGLIALLQVAYSSPAPSWWKLRASVVVAAGAFAVITALSLAPVTVNLTEGSIPVSASCGIDTYLAGYPDQAVQSACRAHFGSRAAAGLLAGAITVGIAGFGWIAVSRPRRNVEHTDKDLVS